MGHAGASSKPPNNASLEILSQRLGRPISAGYERRSAIHRALVDIKRFSHNSLHFVNLPDTHSDMPRVPVD